MELLVRGEDPESEDGKLLIRVEAESSAVRSPLDCALVLSQHAGRLH